MALKDELLCLVAAYCDARGVSQTTLSGWLYKDSRVISRVQDGGGSLTIRTYERCVAWMSSNWPEGAQWPQGVDRPTPGERDPIASKRRHQAALVQASV